MQYALYRPTYLLSLSQYNYGITQTLTHAGMQDMSIVSCLFTASQVLNSNPHPPPKYPGFARISWVVLLGDPGPSARRRPCPGVCPLTTPWLRVHVHILFA